MRINLTIVVMTAFLMQVNAASFAQRITLKSNSITLKKTFIEIRKQTGYIVLYETELLNKTKPIKLNLTDVPLVDALKIMLEGQNLDFSITDKSIVVKEKVDRSFFQKVKDYFLNIDVKGRLVDENGQPLAGASVTVKGTELKIITNEKGEFSFTSLDEKAVLVISFIGYETKELAVKADLGTIRMTVSTGELEEVKVSYNTGYQTLPKERATGSFVQVDNKLFERAVSTNIMDRLDGVVSGMLFNRGARGNQDLISIRGRNTIFANASPLIVVDGFPFDGNIDNINPNDVESITVLKDAAAASIWGARAGNGVVVVVTKSGKRNKPMEVSLNNNVTIGQKPDLYAEPRISSTEFIDLERSLFDQGFYTSRENSAAHSVLPEAVEVFIQQRDGKISAHEAERQLNVLRNSDVRDDFNRYFYRNSINQQYALNVNGGTDKVSYYFSSGYDKNQAALRENYNTRFTLNSLNRFRPVKNLEITAGVNYIQAFNQTNNPGHESITPQIGGYQLAPYARLADEMGNALPIARDYRIGWVGNPQHPALLDWHYRPLDEIYLADNTLTTYDTRLQTSGNYTFIPGLNAEVKYQYQRSLTEGRNYQSVNVYEVRNLINQFTQFNQDGSIRYPVPVGGTMFQDNRILSSNSFRGQLNFNRSFGEKHAIATLGGMEAREVVADRTANKFYGYDDDLATRTTVDFLSSYPKRPSGSGTIQAATGGGVGQAISGTNNRYLSYFFNGAYTFDKRYNLSVSARWDASNLFGVETNQRGIPLWSAGLSWNASKEKFYQFDWLPYLRVRGTYGYNGNTLNSAAAFLTAYYLTSSSTGARYATITNPANPSLRWERVRMLNLAVDFATKANRISGSIEYFQKRGFDIFGDPLFPPSAGIGSVRRNVANTRGKGVDITLNTINTKGAIGWSSLFLFSYAQDFIAKYDLNPTSSQLVQSGAGTASGLLYPIEGAPLFNLYSYLWGGLNPVTGAPVGMLNGKKSEDYTAIVNQTKIEDLVSHGSAVPVFFGGFRNEFSFRNFNLSFNITYKLGYYFRRNTVRYNDANYWAIQHGDYSKRWQNSGDELNTYIPSMPDVPFINISRRDDIYANSSITAIKGDHIRLQDIRFSYDFNKKNFRWLLTNRLQVYFFANQLGLLWRANKFGLDPDNQVIPTVSTYSFGLRTAF